MNFVRRITGWKEVVNLKEAAKEKRFMGVLDEHDADVVFLMKERILL